MQSRLHHLVDTLLGERRGEDDREVGKRCQTFADGVLIALDVLRRLALDEVPFVDAYHQSFLVLLHQRVDIQVLRLDAARSVQHQDADIRVLNRTD